MTNYDFHIQVSAPCRIDIGGTLDIKTFYGLLKEKPTATFNIALDLRTSVTITPYNEDKIGISSKGFEPVEFHPDQTDYNTPLGLIFAITKYFNARGIHINIESASPPKSGLGGSSSAVIATLYGLSLLYKKNPLSIYDMVMLAHKIEQKIIGIPCGLQDHLAVAYGGVNLWLWPSQKETKPFIRKKPIKTEQFDELEKNIIVAYSGVSHESKNINSKWIKDFMAKKSVKAWEKIAELTFKFSEAISIGDFGSAANIMNIETELRREMTEGLFNKAGDELTQSAKACNCGARFTGAGGGGCIWATGEQKNIAKLKTKWKNILASFQDACILESDIAKSGLITI